MLLNEVTDMPVYWIYLLYLYNHS